MAEDKILLSADLGAEARKSLKMLKNAKLADIDSVTLATVRARECGKSDLRLRGCA